MSKLKNFLGPNYTLKSVNYDSQRVVNWHPEYDELQTGKEQEPCMLAPTPGYTLQHTIPRAPIRALYHTANNYIYCVAGSGLFLLTPTVTGGVISWSHTLLAYLTTSTGYVSIVDGIPNQYQGIANTGLINQVVVVDGSTTGYVFQEGTTSVYQMSSGTGYAGSSFVSFQDGFFLFSQPNSISGYYASDPQNISDLNTIEDNLNSDNIARIISDHDLLWALGTRGLSVWQNTGGSQSSNVFQQIPGATAQNGGTGCPWTVAQVGGQLLWVSNDDRGYGEVVMAFGYRPTRISNHAVEIWLQNLGDISQTIAWTYQEEGHSWYCLNSPNASTTWCLDITHKEWHERAYFSGGQYSRDLANFHTNAYIPGYGNIHLVGDFQSGNIYSIDRSNYTHNGSPVVRERITPHQSGAYKRIFYPQLQVDIEAGTGLDGQGYPIQIGTGTPTIQQATNVLLSGNGPTYTLVANDGSVQAPVGTVTITSTGATSNWSGSYTVSGNAVTINPASLTSGTITVGSGNGTETDFQVPNIFGATSQIWVNDWRGNNIQLQAPAKNQNLCLSSYNFSISWTPNDVSLVGGAWNTPDYEQAPAGTYLTEDATFNPHGISIPYTVTAGQNTNLSVYATTAAAVPTAPGTNTPVPPTVTNLTGGVASFVQGGFFPLYTYTMTLNTVFTNGTLAIGDIVNCPALSSTNQVITQLVTGTLGAAGSTYICYPGWTANESSQAVTATRTTQRYLELILGAGSTTQASAIFNLQSGTVVASANCTPVMTPVPNFSGVYRCSINYIETATSQNIFTEANCTVSGNQITLVGPPQYGSITIGSTLWVSGVSTGLTVLSIASGLPNQPGTVYNMSGPPSFSAINGAQFATASNAANPSAYISLITPGYATYGVTSGFQNYPGNGSACVGIWGCQIGPQATVLPLIQTVGLALFDQVTYTASQGILAFEIAPFGEVQNTALAIVQPAAVITGIFTATSPQLQPTEYQATFQYMQGAPIYEYIGTDPQIGLSYSSDGGKTYSSERYTPIGKLGNRYQRLIWRKIKGGVRDMVFKVTCSDPVLINLLGAEIMVKEGESAQ